MNESDLRKYNILLHPEMVLRGNKTLCPSVWQRPIDLTIVHASQHWHLLLTHLRLTMFWN